MFHVNRFLDIFTSVLIENFYILYGLLSVVVIVSGYMWAKQNSGLKCDADKSCKDEKVCESKIVPMEALDIVPRIQGALEKKKVSSVKKVKKVKRKKKASV